VEKQMPKKYEHIVRCKLSKRQRLLYDEFMSLGSTRETLAEGRYMSVINVLMQLRKVCNHPDLFDPRPTLSPFVAEPLEYRVPSAVFNLAAELREQHTQSSLLAPTTGFADLELTCSAFACHRAKRLQTPRKLIEELLTTHVSLLDEQPNASSTSLDLDRFFIDSTLNGLDLCENPRFQAKIRSYLSRSQVMVDLRNLKAQHYRQLVQYMARVNKQKCSQLKPVYGTDLQECIGARHTMQRLKPATATSSLDFGARSHVACLQIVQNELDERKAAALWPQHTATLARLVSHVNEQLCDVGQNASTLEILDRFVVYVPRVWYATKRCADPYESEPIKLRVAHPDPSFYARQRTLIEDITEQVAARKQPTTTTTAPEVTGLARQRAEEVERLQRLVSGAQLTQFPEKRLIQYDCGKLQALAALLRTLYADTHRVLIFTQMTKMLDVLENFLNYHGYKYLRLDGSTGIDRRQALMERFNSDKRVFVFILSTRSGGIGVNLTGADTVVFYDSDWNPTMDAQAQDRCHRIGQTRDVHIYRLVSERTVEENILRKASQKRLLADMAIEGGCFTTALLTKHHITELFDENDTTTAGVSTAADQVQVASRLTSASAVLAVEDVMDEDSVTVSAEETTKPATASSSSNMTTAVTKLAAAQQFEEVLAMVEDETDVCAAKELRAEVNADIAEFDENAEIGGDADDNSGSMRPPRRFDERIELEFKSIETEASLFIIKESFFINFCNEFYLIVTAGGAIRAQVPRSVR
jgi:hypothetical protein